MLYIFKILALGLAPSLLGWIEVTSFWNPNLEMNFFKVANAEGLSHNPSFLFFSTANILWYIIASIFQKSLLVDDFIHSLESSIETMSFKTLFYKQLIMRFEPRPFELMHMISSPVKLCFFL
jgi:hypothetical protein